MAILFPRILAYPVEIYQRDVQEQVSQDVRYRDLQIMSTLLLYH